MVKKVNIFFIIIILFSCNKMVDNNMEFTIDIWDSDYSMAYTLQYHIDNKGIWVKQIGVIEGEKDKVLYTMPISKEQKELLISYLDRFPIDSLLNSYENPLIDDGDQKTIHIKINDRAKSIDVANFYQKDIAKLIELINDVFDDKYKILYKS